MTWKGNIANNQSNEKFDVGNKIIYTTEDLKSDLCDYIDAYILVKGDIVVISSEATDLAF